MTKRVRNYKAEYARRKELERQRAQSEGRAFSLKRARGHGQIRESSRRASIREKVRRLNLTKAPYEGDVEPDDVFDLADEQGWDVVEDALDNQYAMSVAWTDGDYDRATELWSHRNPDLPDWLNHYHGFFY